MNNVELASVSLVVLARETNALIADLEATARDARDPTLLENWSVGHLLTHVARNADSVTRRLNAAMRGERVSQYEGGADGRRAGIEAGAARPYRELVADVVVSAQGITQAAALMNDAAWDAISTSTNGEKQSAALVIERRIREVVIHRSDLGGVYTWRDWPDELVNEINDHVLESLRTRADPTALAAWLTGRAPAPHLTDF